MTKCPLCLTESLSVEIIDDIGYDHQNYQPIKTRKEYSNCINCGSIMRQDTNILNPFKEGYNKSTRESIQIVKGDNGDDKNTKIQTRSRTQQITKLIKSYISPDLGIKTICEFGANNGVLLDSIGKYYKTSNLIGIELPMFKEQNVYTWHESIQGYCQYNSRNQIDLFISSHSLLYTTYKELRELLNLENNPRHICIVNPDHTHRGIQLFYDDVITNATSRGVYELLCQNGYSLCLIQHLNNTKNEYVIIAKKDSKRSRYKNLCEHKNQKIINQKAQILEKYKKQAVSIVKSNDIWIFGTSIDSALLSDLMSTAKGYIKDSASKGEIFKGKPVLKTKNLKSGKIIIPDQMSNKASIRSRLMQNNPGIEVV